MWLGEPFVGAIARLSLRVQTKLLIAFLTIVILLVVLGAVGLYTLSDINRRTEQLIQSERKIAAYRQVQHDTTSQLYSVASALLTPDERTLDSALRQLNQFGYDLERLQFVAKDELELLERVKREYDHFIVIVTQIVSLIRSGHADEAREIQLKEARPLANRLERLTDELVNRAEADVVSVIEASNNAYRTAQIIVIAFAVGAIVLALGLGRAISFSLIGPIRKIDATLGQIAAGDFTRRIQVDNRDELGALGANVNRMSEQLGNLYQQLETASAHKSQFLANMSHELRTPLNAILGYTELLVDGVYGDLPEKPRGVLERVQENGRNLLALINDVLDLAKIEVGQLRLTIDDYNACDLANGVVHTMEPLAGAKGLSLVSRVDGVVPRGRGDAQRLRQVLINLVGNAVKFTDAGVVEVTISAADGRLQVAVRDSGPGIAPEDQEAVFEEFRQIDNSSTRKKGGTGLGLAIARQIVELHGGKLTLVSSLGKGATFAFDIPVIVDAAVGTAKMTRILVVEDAADNRQILRDLLTAAGYELIEAVNGAAGVAAAIEHLPDLVLMDIQLPEIDGYEATRQIKSNAATSAIPVIAVTSYALSGDEAKARAAGCDVCRKAVQPAAVVGHDSRIPQVIAEKTDTPARERPLILVVDDVPDNVEIVRLRLESQSYDVITATDGLEALEQVAASRPDLVLLDVMMPRLDGIATVKRLKADPALPFIPVILLTAKGETKEVIAGLDSGADEYLTKPVDHGALLARVRAMLRIKALHDTVEAQRRTLKEQAAELADWNRLLEERVAAQLGESSALAG
jgi:signal transduction histidine kinase/CheY-like chemotaxis protein